MAVNGIPVTGQQLDDGQDVFKFLENTENYPLSLKFGRPKMTTNEKIFLASMFYPLFAIASQLSPEPKSSGIEVLEADTFKLHCFQTLTGIYLRTYEIHYLKKDFSSLVRVQVEILFSITGVKFMIVAEPTETRLEILLKKIYELYADYVLKNPFYSLEMPIRCELFDQNLQLLLDQVEKSGLANL